MSISLPRSLLLGQQEHKLHVFLQKMPHSCPQQKRGSASSISARLTGFSNLKTFQQGLNNRWMGVGGQGDRSEGTHLLGVEHSEEVAEGDAANLLVHTHSTNHGIERDVCHARDDAIPHRARDEEALPSVTTDRGQTRNPMRTFQELSAI